MTDTIPHLWEFVGARIRKRRQALRLSQVELSRCLCLTRASVVNIECGRQRPSLDTLYQIAEILDIEIGTLMPTCKELYAMLIQPENKPK